MTRIRIESDHKPAVAALVENSLAMQKKAIRTGLKRAKLRLKAFEKEFGQSSQQFYRSYQAGKMGDDEAHMEWEGIFYSATIMHLTRGPAPFLTISTSARRDGENASFLADPPR